MNSLPFRKIDCEVRDPGEVITTSSTMFPPKLPVVTFPVKLREFPVKETACREYKEPMMENVPPIRVMLLVAFTTDPGVNVMSTLSKDIVWTLIFPLKEI